MTKYYVKDLKQRPTDRDETVEDVASTVEAVFENCLFVRKVALVNPADVAGDGMIELLLYVDWKLGVPTNWAIISTNLLRIGGRDVDLYTDLDPRARELHPEAEIIFEYNGGDEYNEECLESFSESAPACAAEATRLLAEDFRANAHDIAEFATKVAWQSMELGITAMGSWTRPEMTYTELLRRAEDFGVVSVYFQLTRAMKELDYFNDCVNFGADIAPIDAINAVRHANEVAHALSVAGHPAFFISIRDPELLALMRLLGAAPDIPKFDADDDVDVLEMPSPGHPHGRWRRGTIEAVDDQSADLDKSQGSWWGYAVDIDDERHEDVPEDRVRGH